MNYLFRKCNLVRHLSIIVLTVISLFIFQSCYPGDEITPADTDLISTFFDQNANFAVKITYAIADTVFRIDGDGNPVIENGLYDQQSINRVITNMNNAGFTKVDDPADADVFVFLFANNSTWVSGGCYGWWYSYWYPYYGWCYPVYYTYQTGTLLISMIDANATEQKDALWVASLNGILEDTSAGIAARINNGIDQAFKQSPYLKK